MEYVYYPGCSLEATAKAYDSSTRAVARELGITLRELEDWNCCGATAYMSVNEFLSFGISGRNLAMAEKQAPGKDIVCPCSGCYTTLKKTTTYANNYPKLKEEINEVLGSANLKFAGNVKVRHLLDVIYNDVGLPAIKAKVKRELSGLKVACYYGCQIVRPECDFDDPEMPNSMDKIVETLGATPVYFPMKTRCCGGSMMGTKQDLSFRLIKNLLLSAYQNKADIMITVCPLCQINIDAYQGQIKKEFDQKFDLPILYFTQLMGLAMGLPEKDLKIKTQIVPAEKQLARFA